MQIRCPHCRQPVELIDEDPSGDLSCSECGSCFNLAVDLETQRDDGSSARTLGHFQLLQRLGQGAFGAVWKARDTELDRTVALKIPRADQLTGEEAEKFLREARAAAQVRHSNIVAVHEVGREEDRIYIASDLIDGPTLDQWVEAHPLTVREAVELCAKVAAALHHAHEAGVVHRDLKPQNILVDMEGEPHITDFGLAKRDAGEVTMTVEGAILGTPAYMSPEQARGEAHQADRRSDVYSLGVILYRLLTGELPFRGRSQMLIVQILKEEPPALRKLDAKIPRDIETVCLKCLEKDPARRYRTSAELAADLGRWLTGHPITARRVGRLERTWRWCCREPKLALLTGGIALSLLAGTAISTWFALDALEQARLEGIARRDAEHQEGEAKKYLKQANDNARLANKNADLANAHAARSDLLFQQSEANLRLADRRLYNAHMNLVQVNWVSGNLGVVRDLLDQHRPPPDAAAEAFDPRGFEWYYWERQCNSDLRTLQVRSDSVRRVAFSPDGSRIASANGDGTVKLWDVATGQEIATFKGHSDWVMSVAFSPDGTRIASASADRTVKLWDAATGQETATLKGHTSSVTCVAFSPDGRRIASASGSPDRTVKLWDVATGQETATLKGHSDTVLSVAFSPNGDRLVSAGEDRTVKLWDTSTGQQRVTFNGHSDEVAGVAFSPDGTRIASASADRTVKLWDASTGQEIATLNGHSRWVGSVTFSPDGAQIASAGGDQTVKLWDASTGVETATLKAHSSRVMSLVFSPDGTRIASASDRTVKLWDASTGQGPATLKGNRSVAFSPDGARIASASYDRTVKLWDASPGQEIATLKGHSRWVRTVAFSPDGARIASDGGDQTVRLWDASTGAETATLNGQFGAVGSVAFSPDGARIATPSGNGTVKVWDVATGHEIATLKGHSGTVWSVAFSTDRLGRLRPHGETVGRRDGSGGRRAEGPLGQRH